MPPPGRLSLGSALCGFVCHSRKLPGLPSSGTWPVRLPLQPLIQSLPYSQEAVSQDVPSFPKPAKSSGSKAGPSTSSSKPAHSSQSTRESQKASTGPETPPNDTYRRAEVVDEPGKSSPSGCPNAQEKIVIEDGLIEKLMDDDSFKDLMGEDLGGIDVHERDERGRKLPDDSPTYKTLKEMDEYGKNLEEELKDATDRAKKKGLPTDIDSPADLFEVLGMDDLAKQFREEFKDDPDDVDDVDDLDEIEEQLSKDKQRGKNGQNFSTKLFDGDEEADKFADQMLDSMDQEYGLDAESMLISGMGTAANHLPKSLRKQFLEEMEQYIKTPGNAYLRKVYPEALKRMNRLRHSLRRRRTTKVAREGIPTANSNEAVVETKEQQPVKARTAKIVKPTRATRSAKVAKAVKAAKADRLELKKLEKNLITMGRNFDRRLDETAGKDMDPADTMKAIKAGGLPTVDDLLTKDDLDPEKILKAMEEGRLPDIAGILGKDMESGDFDDWEAMDEGKQSGKGQPPPQFQRKDKVSEEDAQTMEGDEDIDPSMDAEPPPDAIDTEFKRAIRIDHTKFQNARRQKVIDFNNRLIAVATIIKRGKFSDSRIRYMWKQYCLLRGDGFSRGQIPQLTWDFLWSIFDQEFNNPGRMHYIFNLAKDMTAAGAEITPAQQLQAIESMYADGWFDEAIENWKRAASTLGADANYFFQYWSLGIQMLCLERDLERAEQALQVVLTSEHPFDPRVMLPFVDASARNPEWLEKAWNTYRDFRERMGAKMTVEDYDQVIHSFLGQGYMEYALYVFVDMMTRGEIDLRARRGLPSSIGNKFFFGKWLKRLIGAGDLAGAERVVGLMIEKGIRPAPIQLNGLIGAWLRSATQEHCDKAEKLGWEMIQARLDFVEARRHSRPLALAAPVRAVNVNAPVRAFPRATSETFALMAEYYRARVSFTKLENIWKVVNEAEIEIDGYLLAPLLESKLKTGDEASVLDFFFGVVSKNNMQLSWAAFKPLWLSLSINRLQSVSLAERQRVRPVARRLFSEMMKSVAPLTADARHAPDHVARTILNTFQKLEDYVGLLVAFRALVGRFKLRVTDTVVMHLLTGRWRTETHRISGWPALLAHQATHRIAKFLARRLRATGKNVESLTPEDRSRELTLYLDRVISAQVPGLGSDRAVEKRLALVSMDMGVNFNPGEYRMLNEELDKMTKEMGETTEGWKNHMVKTKSDWRYGRVFTHSRYRAARSPVARKPPGR